MHSPKYKTASFYHATHCHDNKMHALQFQGTIIDKIATGYTYKCRKTWPCKVTYMYMSDFINIYIHIQLHDDNVALNTALLLFQNFKSEKFCLNNRFIYHLKKHITFY